MVYELRKQPMAWMETDYSDYKHLPWKIKWRLEHLGAIGIMGETVPLGRKREFILSHPDVSTGYSPIVIISYHDTVKK